MLFPPKTMLVEEADQNDVFAMLGVALVIQKSQD